MSPGRAGWGGHKANNVLYVEDRRRTAKRKFNGTNETERSESCQRNRKIGKSENREQAEDRRLKAEGNEMKSEKGNKANQAQTLSGRYTSSYTLLPL